MRDRVRDVVDGGRTALTADGALSTAAMKAAAQFRTPGPCCQIRTTI